ncbi:uncharacterized protein MELLADRAFT_87712 [Melampsora larici-populina 98AG31]|uniref:Tet-like 2OG-Fe(II) oxygenase domain-containing protein n=1 Tax=Melampsora larici-populina (strain 98AG31 / pathotype 3-4-7) TaxID=747676 RepID=F4RNT2_MELLP|nr:uncharacterized protein MELLADRAFT_87712 [Melampsora larici-populina 98AG31]EGG05857.1 hypothetical protein MELLADRAFT_87712 [Melampsora larici-populina 98AG31]
MEEVVKKPKHKSPSTIRCRKAHSLRQKLERKKNRPAINQRSVKLAQLTELYGLPPETKFLFFKKGQTTPTRIHFGTVVCLDEDTSELLLVARFVERTPTNLALFERYNHAISTVYHHAKARGIVKTNGAAKKVKAHLRKYGKMHAAGFRPGYDHIAKAGPYAFNATTSGQLWRMQEDLERQGNLPAIEDFYAERFAGLSSYAFNSNAELASRVGVPSWAGESFYVSPNAQVFASNIAVTYDEFYNAKHTDLDESKYTFGFFTRINRHTGKLYSLRNDPFQGDSNGSQFFLDNYNVTVDFDACDGVVEMLWASQTDHHTSNSKTFNKNNVRVIPARGSITRFGCACQINKRLVERIQEVNNMRGDLCDDSRKKLVRLAEKKGIDDFALVFP